jgi:hypothetical protein
MTPPRHTAADYFKLPRDSAAGVFIVTVNYYEPNDFWLFATRQSWGSGADKRKADQDFQAIIGRFIAHGQVPLIIGESGAVRQEGYEAVWRECFSYAQLG